MNADAGYIFPRHSSEVDRLDLQHYALREAVGAKYLAPVLRPTSRTGRRLRQRSVGVRPLRGIPGGARDRHRPGAKQAQPTGELLLRQEQSIVIGSLGEYLLQAGVTDVKTRSMAIPIGEWAGRIGSFMASDFRAGATRMCDVFQARFGLSAAECQDLLARMPQEWEEVRSALSFAFALGQKPR